MWNSYQVVRLLHGPGHATLPLSPTPDKQPRYVRRPITQIKPGMGPDLACAAAFRANLTCSSTAQTPPLGAQRGKHNRRSMDQEGRTHAKPTPPPWTCTATSKTHAPPRHRFLHRVSSLLHRLHITAHGHMRPFASRRHPRPCELDSSGQRALLPRRLRWPEAPPPWPPPPPAPAMRRPGGARGGRLLLEFVAPGVARACDLGGEGKNDFFYSEGISNSSFNLPKLFRTRFPKIIARFI